MLYLNFGIEDKTIMNVSKRFNLKFKNEWLRNELVKRMIKDIDKSEVIADRIIDSPILGLISPKELSGGVKALMLMLFEPEYRYYGTNCGDNCAKWILEIAVKQDIYLDFLHLMRFPEPFQMIIRNNNKTIYTMRELINESILNLKIGEEDE